MPLFPTSALWPDRDRPPLLRLGLALISAPAVMTMLLGIGAFLVAGMTQLTSDGVLRATLRSTVALGALAFLFTFTFGLVGVALLWATGRRRLLAWAVMGAGAGALAGALFGALAMDGVRGAIVAAFALSGWAILVMIRGLAGVRDGVPPA
jgi:hypothetical protein